MSLSHRVLLLLVMLFATAPPGSALAAQEEPEYPTPEKIEEAKNAPLFTSHDLINLTLTADFRSLSREDRDPEEDSEERPATLEWIGADGMTNIQDIMISTRGNFRLSRRNCDFPPLRLNIKKGEVKGTLFEIQDKIKLVSPCKLKQDYWQQYVLSEYLVYRMLNLLTSWSFRVRLAEITYIDETGEEETFSRYAFLIEDDSELAKRNASVKWEWQGGQLNPVLLDKPYAILVEFFQYMIGNTDWSGPGLHNMELLRDANGKPFTVPFDFDFSGIVDARYAVPDQSLSIRSVRDRDFRGYCPDQMGRQPDQYQGVIELFQEKREEIYGLWQAQEGLDEDRVKDTIEYLDDFFEILDDPDKVQREILDQCVRIG